MYTVDSLILKISLTVELNMNCTEVFTDLYKGLKSSQAQK